MQRPVDYVDEQGVHLETISRHSFTAPYTVHGEGYANGEVYIVIPGGCPPFYDAKHRIKIIKSVSLKLPKGGHVYPLQVTEQSATSEGIVLKARVDYGSDFSAKASNERVGTFEGQELKIVLFEKP